MSIDSEISAALQRAPIQFSEVHSELLMYRVNIEGIHIVEWSIFLDTTNRSCKVLGFPLASNRLIGIAILQNDRTVTLFDACTDGYANKMDHDIDGLSVTPTEFLYSDLVEFTCSNCGCHYVQVQVLLYYPASAVSVFSTDPCCNISDMYSRISLVGVCSQCGSKHTILDQSGL